MTTPPIARALPVLFLVVGAVALVPARAAADMPMLGFTDRGAKHQREYEQRFQRGLDAGVIRRASRTLSRRPRPTGTPGLRRAFDYSVARLRGYGLTVSTPSYRVYASRPRDVSVTMTAPSTRELADREHAGDVVEG